MDVSVLVPIHGNGQYLDQMLNSIKRQSFDGELQVVLVLDRCTEAVLQVIDNYRSSLDIALLNSKVPGIVAALNLGLQSATGKYVARIDADDVMMPRRIKEQFDFMESNQEVLVLGSSVIEINEVGITVGNRSYPTEASLMYKSLSKQCTIAHPSVMFRREEILKLGSYRSFFEYAEDYDLWLRARDFGKIITVIEPLTFYRIHSNQISTLRRKQGVFASYSARINIFLDKKRLTNLIIRYKTFENWENSNLGRSLFKYLGFRIFISDKFHFNRNNK